LNKFHILETVNISNKPVSAKPFMLLKNRIQCKISNSSYFKL